MRQEKTLWTKIGEALFTVTFEVLLGWALGYAIINLAMIALGLCDHMEWFENAFIMVFGTIFWVAIAVFSWRHLIAELRKRKKFDLGGLIATVIVSAPSIISVAGIFDKSLRAAAAWCDAAILLIFFVALISQIPEFLRNGFDREVRSEAAST